MFTIKKQCSCCTYNAPRFHETRCEGCDGDNMYVGFILRNKYNGTNYVLAGEISDQRPVNGTFIIK